MLISNLRIREYSKEWIQP